MLREGAHERYADRIEKNGGEAFRTIERHVMLSSVDATGLQCRE